MFRLQITFLLFLVFFSACSTSSTPLAKENFYHCGIYFGTNLTPNAKKGIIDGCKTSKGIYAKSHTLFNNNNAYYNGWFLGRKKCKKLLKIDKNGELIL